MEAILSKIPTLSDSALYVKNHIAPYIDYPLHIHPEFELVYIKEGYGKRIIGDHIDDFEAGDLVFLSPNLPHVWQCDRIFYQQPSVLSTTIYVLHFCPDALGSDFFDIPDLYTLRKLFKNGEKGVLIKGKLKQEIVDDLFALYKLKGMRRIILFLEMLLKISESEETELLSSIFYNNPYRINNRERFELLYSYILHNFKLQIKIEDIAAKLNMTQTSLCRYYKKQTGKTLVSFINEIRIKYACSLLRKTDKTIMEICFESGFNNVSYFNRQFKVVMNLTPLEYKQAR